MHGLGLHLQHKQERIKELEREVASLRRGSQPASRVRDMVLRVLLRVSEILDGPVEVQHRAIPLVKQLITALGDNIPGGVAYKPTPPPHESGRKEYKPLDHGQRDNEAAAAQYRIEPR